MSGTLILTPSAFRPYAATFTFVTVNLPNGYLPELAEHVEEDLTTPGVDGIRFRQVYDQYPDVEVTTLQGYSSYTVAVAWAEAARRAIGSNGVLTVVTNSKTIKIPAHIRAMAPLVRPGPVGGVSGSAASVKATWILRRIGAI